MDGRGYLPAVADRSPTRRRTRSVAVDAVAEHNQRMWERLAKAGIPYTRPQGRPPSERGAAMAAKVHVRIILTLLQGLEPDVANAGRAGVHQFPHQVHALLP